ncbi:FGGY family carbohydrate kinase, partial [Staphylococcus lugdunensis]
ILNEAVLGIDIGTSSVKVIAVSKEGEVLAKVSEGLDIIQLQSGCNEQQPDEWFEATKSCIRQILSASALSDIYIRGLSLSGQMHSLVVLD